LSSAMPQSSTILVVVVLLALCHVRLPARLSSLLNKLT
jgi:hypothetical protein